jgi:tetratricopeptide (TPR) repeat protein
MSGWWVIWKVLAIVLAMLVCAALLAMAVFVVLGIIAIGEGNLSLLGRAVLGGLGSGLVVWLLGQGYRKARKRANDLAIAAHAAVIGLDAADAVAHSDRGTVCMAKGEYARAIAHFEEAIRLAPEQPYAYVGRVNAYAALGQLDRMIAEYSEAIRLDPEQTLAYCARATAYNALGRFDLALGDASEAIRLAPQLYLGHDARGYANWQRGNFNVIIKGLAIAWMLATLGFLRRDHFDPRTPTGTRADLEQALADFSEAIRLEPRAWDCYRGRALVYRALGDRASATVDEAWACQLLGR